VGSKAYIRQGVVVHVCNSSTQKLRHENFEFEASMGYIISSRPPWDISRPCFKKKKKSVCRGINLQINQSTSFLKQTKKKQVRKRKYSTLVLVRKPLTHMLDFKDSVEKRRENSS
jgi:hypothetical protein